MIEIRHELLRYNVHFTDILCCDCFYDEIYFLLRKKVDFEKFEERFSGVENCYFDFAYGSVVITCYDFLTYTARKYRLIGNNCITELVHTKPDKTEICSICAIHVFKRIDVLHIFKLRWL